MKKLISLLLISMLLFVSIGNVFASNNYQYTNHVSFSPDRSRIVSGSGTEHIAVVGNTTAMSLSSSRSTSVTASSTVEFEISSAFASVASSIGLSQTASQTATVGVAFTLGSNQPSGLYRLVHKYPGRNLTVTKWTTEPAYVDSWSVSYAPKPIDAYLTYERYGSVN